MKKLNISQVDTIFANGSYPIEFLIYYQNKLKSKNIRSALRKLSSVFWPVFGQYHAGIIQFNKYSEGKFFDETVCDAKFDREDPAGVIQDRYSQLISPDPNTLFFLKIIQPKNGTILIPKLNHLAGDGYSYFYFLSVLAALSHVGHIPFKKYLICNPYKPHHKRTILKEFRFEETELESLQQDEKLSVKFEEISRAAIRGMIKDVASNSNQPVSTNDILSAMITRNLFTVQKEYSGDDFCLTIPIDVRRHIREYGTRYFGNGLMLSVKNFKISDIENASIHNLAIEIRKSMPAITRESFLKYLDHIETIVRARQFKKLRPFDPERGCLVTNLSRLPADKLNFGTGDPNFIFPLTIEKNSAAILANKNNFILRLAY